MDVFKIVWLRACAGRARLSRERLRRGCSA